MTHDSSGVRALAADVVVVGAGPAGMAAVAAASAAGAEVVAVEAREHIGGNAVWSTGYLAFVDSEAQRREGIVDDEESFVADARRMVDDAQDRFGVEWDENLVRLFARQSAETYRILIERGVRFSRFIPRPRQHTIDRMLATEDTWAYQRAFQSDFESSNVTTLLSSRAERLVCADGRVGGVLVRGADDRLTEVTARRGVVLAAGGYQANPKLRGQYQPGYIAQGPYLGVDTACGDGHLLGQSVGADLFNMTFVPPLVMVSSSLVEDAIAVNLEGRRFHDEAGPYDDRVDLLLEQTNRTAHYIFDDEVAREKAQLIAQMPAPAVVRPSLTSLADAIGVPPGHLTETVDQWNGFLGTDVSVDPNFGRVVLPPRRRQIRTGPFTAVPMSIGVNFSCGGFRVTDQMQVLDVFGMPVVGLYSAGDCVGGLNPTSDLGGIHISGGFTLGRVAGAAAACNARDDVRRGTAFGVSGPSSLATKIALVRL